APAPPPADPPAPQPAPPPPAAPTTPTAAPQYQAVNNGDTNSAANNALPSPTQTVSNSDPIPASVDGTTILNVSLNDLVNCSNCNVSISIRIASPGDNGPVTQTNSFTTSATTTALKTLTQSLVQAPMQPAPMQLAPSPLTFQAPPVLVPAPALPLAPPPPPPPLPESFQQLDVAPA